MKNNWKNSKKIQISILKKFITKNGERIIRIKLKKYNERFWKKQAEKLNNKDK